MSQQTNKLHFISGPWDGQIHELKYAIKSSGSLTVHNQASRMGTYQVIGNLALWGGWNDEPLTEFLCDI